MHVPVPKCHVDPAEGQAGTHQGPAGGGAGGGPAAGVVAAAAPPAPTHGNGEGGTFGSGEPAEVARAELEAALEQVGLHAHAHAHWAGWGPSSPEHTHTQAHIHI